MTIHSLFLILPTLFSSQAISLQSIIDLMGSGGCSSTLMIMITIAFLFFFLLCSSSTSANIVGSGRCIERERRALLAIKQDIYQPPPADTDTDTDTDTDGLKWSTATDCCTWRGVICDNETNHVVKLDLRYPDQYLYDENYFRNTKYLNLSQAGFGGTIPPQIGNLSNLRFLDLGEFSSLSVGENLGWLSHFSFLEYLDMAGVNFSMASDHWIHQVNMLPSLSVLILSDVKLDDVGVSTNLDHLNFTSLAVLDLSQNQFKAMPNWLLNLSSLVHLNLGTCGLQTNARFLDTLLRSLGHLRFLNMESNNIAGKFSEASWNLSQLEFLSLGDNIELGGNIPETIGNLIHLQHLDLSHNMITGELPNTIGNLVHLQELDLSVNMITGELPNTIGNLVKLQVLDLDNNNISGQLTSVAIGRLCKLYSLHLSGNYIGGEVTTLIDGLSKNGMIVLDLSQNKFNGTIPKSLGQLSSLYILDLSFNSFTGRLTEAHFSNLSSLHYLYLSYNQVEVTFNQSWVPPFNAYFILMCSCHLGPKFPAWFQTQTNLQELCVSEAGISDNIPSWLEDLTNMDSLNASHNQIRGQLPPSLNAKQLDLSYNNLDGHIPSHFITDQKYSSWYLSLSHNRLGGNIPLDLINPTWSIVLDLSYNNFEGPLPLYQNNQFSLQILDLSNNNLSGQIPAAIGSYTSLRSLHLENNNLTGEIPSTLKHCDQLVVLDIGENGLTGNIPDWIGEFLLHLRVLRLRANIFCGNIPKQLSNLSQLQVLDLAHNNLSSLLPPSFGSFEAMSTMMRLNKPITDDNGFKSYYTDSILITAKGGAYEYNSILSLVLSIDLSDNSIYGEIPEELTRLFGLVFLNLSSNRFTGKIPKNIGVMKQLQSLDLSINNISGTIPSSMSSLNFLSSLNLSNNNLSGKIPSGSQLSTFENTTYSGNLALCGSPLPLCPVDEPSQVPPHVEDQDEREEKTEIIGICISIALGFISGFWGIMVILRITHFRLTDKIYDYVYVKFAIYFAKVKYMIVKDNR